MLKWITFLLALAVTLSSDALRAEESGGPALVYPCAKAAAPIQVDGALGRDEWAGTVEVSGFTISKTNDLVPEQASFRITYDDQQLYLGVKCREPEMKQIVAKVTDWDGMVWRDDCVEIFVDVGHTEEAYFQFIINALGTGYDGKNLDPLWSGKWRCAAKRGPEGWSVEAAIPFASLETDAPAANTVWGINVCRERRAGSEVQLLNWANVQGNFHRPGLFGHLLFVDQQWDPAKPNGKAIADALAEARLFVDDGYWEIKAEGAARHVTYHSLLQEKLATIPKISTLKEEFEDEGAELILMRFQPIEDQVERIKRLAAGSRQLGAEDWAVSTAILDGLEDRLGDMYWRIKLDLLLKEL